MQRKLDFLPLSGALLACELADRSDHPPLVIHPSSGLDDRGAFHVERWPLYTHDNLSKGHTAEAKLLTRPSGLLSQVPQLASMWKGLKTWELVRGNLTLFSGLFNSHLFSLSVRGQSYFKHFSSHPLSVKRMPFKVTLLLCRHLKQDS